MKTALRNIALLDARMAALETIEKLASISNVAMLFVSSDNKSAMSAVPTENVAITLEVSPQARLLTVNGKHTLCASDGLVYLVVNGKLSVDQNITAQEIKSCVAGGVVNGKIFCSKSQLAALSASGVRVNGKTAAYPDGCALRDGKAPFTLAEAEKADRDLYLMDGVIFGEGAAAALKAKGISLYGFDAPAVYEKDADDLRGIWRGQGALRVLPEGYKLVEGDLDISAADSYRLRGKLYITGALTLRKGASLAGLQGLIAEGGVTLPEDMIDAILSVMPGDPELRPYEGVLVENNNSMNIDAAMLAQLPERVTIVNNASLSFDEGAEPAALLAKLARLRNNGFVSMTSAQRGALLPVIDNFGEISQPGRQDESEKTPEPDDPDVAVIENCASYTL